jgi:hypothetical protein
VEINVGTVKVDSILVGRVLGGVVIGIALINGIYWGTKGGFWAFLGTIDTPMGIGFLIIVATEILRRVSGRTEEQ